MKYCLHFFTVVGFILNGIRSSAQQQKATVKDIFPGKSWEWVDPKKVGWDSNKLAHLRQFIIDSTNTTGMMVVYKGQVVFSFGDIEELSYIASCRKSVMAMLYGPFVKDRKINLAKTLKELGIDDVGGLLPIEKEATIQNILTARSGVYHSASNAGDDSDKAPARGTKRPGKYFLYNNWDFNVAGYILEKETGMDLYHILDSVIAKPTQMEDFHLSAQVVAGDTTKSIYPAKHMVFSTRDMARIGYLMLRKGCWNNIQIIPQDWISKITSVQTPYSEAVQNNTNYLHFSYGYLWWLWDNSSKNPAYQGAYTATGAYGQFISVFPAIDMVIAHKTDYKYRRQVSTELYLKIVDKIVQAR